MKGVNINCELEESSTVFQLLSAPLARQPYSAHSLRIWQMPKGQTTEYQVYFSTHFFMILVPQVLI